MILRRLLVLLALAACPLFVTDWVLACTGVQVRTKDGTVITGRTMEFGRPMDSDVLIVPRGRAYNGTAPGEKPGLRWTTKYGVVGMNGLKLPQVVDGVNEQGLGVGLFYFPGYAKYQTVSESNVQDVVAPWELGTYLLTTCANVEEAVQAAQRVVVAPTVFTTWGFTPPAHYRLQDASGKAAVLEHVDGKLKVHDNPLGVITNAPTFDWHMTNLQNYINISPTGVQPTEVGTVKLAPLGVGSGMLGLPGDFTSPSRFVRAVAFSQSAVPVASATDGVKQVFHILNTFDIPRGAVRVSTDGKTVEETQWTSVTDLTNRKFYFRTFDNSQIRVIDLKKCDLGAKEVAFLPVRGDEDFVDFLKKSN